MGRRATSPSILRWARRSRSVWGRSSGSSCPRGSSSRWSSAGCPRPTARRWSASSRPRQGEQHPRSGGGGLAGQPARSAPAPVGAVLRRIRGGSPHHHLEAGALDVVAGVIGGDLHDRIESRADRGPDRGRAAAQHPRGPRLAFPAADDRLVIRASVGYTQTGWRRPSRSPRAASYRPRWIRVLRGPRHHPATRRDCGDERDGGVSVLEGVGAYAQMSKYRKIRSTGRQRSGHLALALARSGLEHVAVKTCP